MRKTFNVPADATAVKGTNRESILLTAGFNEERFKDSDIPTATATEATGI